MKQPAPKPTKVVCDVCGLDWAKHEAAMKTKTQKPNLETCVELLKTALAAKVPNQYSNLAITGNSMAGYRVQ